MQKKATSQQLSDGLFILIVVLIIVAVNIISTMLFGRLDLTENKMYSLSDASKNLMRNMDDKIFAKAYFTEGLPAPYNSHVEFVKDLFEEYSAYSGGKFKFEFIDPSEDENSQQNMMIQGIQPAQVQEIRNDKFEVIQAYLGIVFYYADKKEVIPFIRSATGLEYEITSTIRKLIADKLKIVGFLQGHEEPSPRETMKRTLVHIEKNYKLDIVNMTEGEKKSIPDEIGTLVIVSPKKKIPEKELFQIDQFLMKGKTIAFFTDAVDVQTKTFQASNINTGLNKLMKYYGISVNSDLVSDLQSQRINVATQQGMMRMTQIIEYPLIPVITDLDRDNTLTERLRALSLPFPSSLEIAADTEKVKYTVLGRTTDRSWLQTGQYTINPRQREVFSPSSSSKMGPFPMLAYAKGRFKSYFANQAGISNPYMPFLSDPASILKESPETRILVTGDGSFVQDEYGDATNSIFFANCIDWLLQDDALISIRSRGLQNKPIIELESWERNSLKYLNMIGVPIFFILAGLIRWLLRRARRKGFQMAASK